MTYTDPDRQRAERLKAIEDIARLARQRPVDRGIDAVTIIREQRRERTDQILRSVGASQKRR